MPKVGITDHGITTATPDEVLLGAGVVYKNFTYNTDAQPPRWEGDILGATSGGNKLSITPEMIDFDLDGCSVPVEGISRVKAGETAELETNLVQLNADLIAKSIIGKAVGEPNDALGVGAGDIVPGFDLIVTKPLVQSGDYYDNLAYVGKRSDGTPIIIILGRALTTGGFAIEGKNKEKGTFPVKFEAVAPLTDDGVTYGKLPIKIYLKSAEGEFQESNGEGENTQGEGENNGEGTQG